jgi:hypothetical protein
MMPSVSTTTDTVRNLTPPPEVAAASGATVPASNPAPDNQSLLQSKFAAFM